MKPSIGRIVHYTAYGTPGGEFKAGACRAAVVTAVNGENEPMPGALSLCVLNPTGQYFNHNMQQDKAASGPDCSGGTPGTWHWPARVEG